MREAVVTSLDRCILWGLLVLQSADPPPSASLLLLRLAEGWTLPRLERFLQDESSDETDSVAMSET